MINIQRLHPDVYTFCVVSSVVCPVYGGTRLSRRIPTGSRKMDWDMPEFRRVLPTKLMNRAFGQLGNKKYERESMSINVYSSIQMFPHLLLVGKRG